MRIVFRGTATATSSPLSFPAANRQPDALCNTASECGPAGYDEGTVTITNPPTATRTPTLCAGCPTATPTATPAPLNLGVNVGGPAYTDSQGQPWQADQAYAPGGWGYAGTSQTYAASNRHQRHQRPTLYQSERYGMSQYVFDVLPGTYSVTMKFAEIYFQTSPATVSSASLPKGRTSSTIST